MKIAIDPLEVRYLSIFRCSQGVGAVVATGRGVYEVFLPFSCFNDDQLMSRISAHYPYTKEENGVTRRGALLLTRYFAGEEVKFDLPLDRRRITSFQSEVYDCVSGIPFGSVKSYREIAENIGRPNSARAVGAAMASNPYPIIVPCHRVVGSTGGLTGYSAPGGVESKRWLLNMEGKIMSV